MKQYIKNRSGKTGIQSFFWIMGVLLCCIWIGVMCMRVRAGEQDFIIDAQVYPSDMPIYNIGLTIENLGENWEGIVRLTIESRYGGTDDCAYDTVISLPQGSKKQLTVRMMKDSIDTTDGAVRVTLIDKKSKVTVQKDFDKLLQQGADTLMMGILSDTYSTLTYLDMGGNEVKVHQQDHSYPVKLKELNKDNLRDSLADLNFLVIDNYDTSVLTDEMIKNIELWTDKGGVLLIGTGNNVSKTLGGFGYLGIQSSATQPPAKGLQDINALIDVSQLYFAELEDANDIYHTSYGTLIHISSQGKGVAGVLPYALTELAGLDASAYQDTEQEEFVRRILEELIDSASIPYGKQGQDHYGDWYLFGSAFELLGNGSNRLHFGGLKLIVILYVIFVGPVLYLILRFIKKQDLYWLSVPAAALVGIFLVYWAGRGFEVVDARVYSVTMENLSGEKDSMTYLRCYDADHKEWRLRLKEGYDYAGVCIDNYYGEKNPYYHIRQEGSRISFGADPTTSFEDCYFQAGSAVKSESGSISGDIHRSMAGIEGSVTNNTDRDFAYFVVIDDNTIYLYKDLPLGKSVDLSTEIFSSDASYDDVVRAYLYDYLREVCRSKDRTDIDVLSALGMGIAYSFCNEGPDKTMIIGVSEDWDKTVDDKCSETAYGCLYTVQDKMIGKR